MHTDVLVIGTGIAGLTYALKLAETSPETKITLICKDQLKEGNTRYAQGGIAVVSDFEHDTFEKHCRDTYIAGDKMGNKSVIQFVIEEGKDRLDELIQWGTQFDLNDNQHLALTKEGGHSENRIVHYKDHSGAEIQRALIDKIKTKPNINYYEKHILVDLITDHHVKENIRRCFGAYIISTTDQKIITITAELTVLSTGGLGQLYRSTTNPQGATGDGLGAAYRAKVQLRDLPYVQFHPTALYPKVNNETFLVTEALRGEGAILRNLNGEAFMHNYHPQKDLAPRDVVARSIVREMLLHKHPHVVLDLAEIPRETILEHFPTIVNQCRNIGIDPCNDPIPVVPAAHYSCGGIAVNSFSKTDLDGLYAIGECSATGLHGANRLASNSLLESIVFSHRAALKSLEELNQWSLDKSIYARIPDWNGRDFQKNNQRELTENLRLKLTKIMSEKVGIFKTSAGLLAAQKEINSLYHRVVELYNYNTLSSQICELRNMVSVAYVLVNQSLEIKENKGVFYNKDYDTEHVL